jgi:drug/metabolite transporter (DMT)-like permease
MQRHSSDYVHLFVIYVIWGSGYLAMKLGVSGPDAFTAFQMQSIRLLIGGAILAAIAWSRGRWTHIGAREWGLLAASAFLFWVCGNGFALLALRDLPSGFVAMAMGTIPLWSAAFEVVRTRRRPGQPMALAIGFLGLVLIYLPTLSVGDRVEGSTLSVVLLFIAPIAWIIGTSLQPPLQRTLDGTAAAGLQLMLGGAMAFVLALAEGVPLPAPPSTQTLAATMWMAIIASALSFQSYVRSTALFSPNVVSAFAYINPIVGVVLGWLVLSEVPAPVSLVGILVVIGSVALTLNGTRAGTAVPADPLRQGERL